MERILFIPFLALLASCGDNSPHQGSDELLAYIPKFEAASQAVNKPIKVGDIEMKMKKSLAHRGAGVLGFCTVIPGKTPEIEISKPEWETMTEIRREQLMFHEMGHCVLKRLHFDLRDPISNNPISIMATQGASDEAYTKHRTYYLYELFWNPGIGGAVRISDASR